MRKPSVQKMAEAALEKAGHEAEAYIAASRQELAETRPASPADVIEIGKEIIEAHAHACAHSAMTWR